MKIAPVRSGAAALGLLWLAAPWLLAQSEPWREVGELVVRRLALEPGERVLLATSPGRFEALVPVIRAAVKQAGGIDLGVLRAQGRQPPASELRARLRAADAVLLLPGVLPPNQVYGLTRDILGVGLKRAVHFHWEGAFPVAGYPLPPQEEVDAVYRRALLDVDYPAVARAQKRFEAALRRGEVHVETPLGTDLTFRVGERPVNRQDGDASRRRARQARVIVDREVELPCGALRVAPLEETVEGVIAFPPSQWSGKPVEGLKVYFAKGMITRFEATAGRQAVEEELEGVDETARAFREFALGFNPELAFTRTRSWIAYYGYGAGVVRLSLGDNAELGGAVRGNYVRWNFFTDATVTVGGRVWVERGRLTGPLALLDPP